MCGEITYRESILFYNVEAPARCHSALAPHAAQLARGGAPGREDWSECIGSRDCLSLVHIYFSEIRKTQQGSCKIR